MESSVDEEIWQSLELLPSELGSRRVTSDQLRALLKDLEKEVPIFTTFEVRRLGEHERNCLYYPINRLPEALDLYNVRRIRGRGYLNKEDPYPFIEIDLWDGVNANHRDWLFCLYGPKPQVDSVALVLREHVVSRWHRTWHRWLHHQKWNGVGTFILLMVFGWQLCGFLASPSLSEGLTISALVYLLGFMALVLVGTKSRAPFIWFYRPGSLIETRRRWFPALSIGAVGAVLYGVYASGVWSLIAK